MTIDPTNFHFSVEPLGKNHDRSAFSSGNPALDAYFRTQARQDAEKNAAATFVLLDTRAKTVAGFYSLSSTAIPLDKIPPEIAKKLPRYALVPATLLGRLAIDSIYRGQGLGEFLLLHALERSFGLGKQVASAAVIVDAKDDAARSFYLKHHFLELPDQPMRLFLPMKTIEKLFK